MEKDERYGTPNEVEEEEDDVIEPNSEYIKVDVSILRVHDLSRAIYGERKSSRVIKELAENMRLVGQLEPITINSQNYILSGVRRYYAALNLGWHELKAIRRSNYDPDLEAEIIVSHNKQRVKTARQIVNEAEAILGLLGKNQGRRNDLLKADENNPYGEIGRNRFEVAASVIGNTNSTELRRLISISDFEKESEENKQIGFLDKVVSGELKIYRAVNLIKDLKKQKEEKSKALKKIKDPVVVVNNDQQQFVIYNSSSDNMREVKSGSVQVVFTSPPYWQQRMYDNKNELGLEKTVQEYIEALSVHLRDVKRVLNDQGSFFLNIGDTYRAGENLLIPTRLLLNLCDKEGWFAINEIIWKKDTGVPQGKTKRLQPLYEKVFHLVKDPHHYYYEEFKNWREDKEVKLLKMRGSRTALSTEKNTGGYIISKQYDRFRDFLDAQEVKNIISGTTAAPRQLELKRLDSDVDHPALMPLYLPIIPILTTSKDGDIVLDPFSGSGTTGKAAIIFGRKYIGYEMKEEFYHLSMRDLTETVESLSNPETNPGGTRPPIKKKKEVFLEEEPWDDEPYHPIARKKYKGPS